eukprot:531392-Prymnesium_polylepis.1
MAHGCACGRARPFLSVTCNAGRLQGLRAVPVGPDGLGWSRAVPSGPEWSRVVPSGNERPRAAPCRAGPATNGETRTRALDT